MNVHLYSISVIGVLCLHIMPVFGRLAGPNRAWLLFIFHARPVSFRYISHVTIMFTYQIPTRHALVGDQKRAYSLYLKGAI